MQQRIEHIGKWGLALLIGSLGFVSCNTSNVDPNPPAASSISADGGTVVLAGWVGVAGVYQFNTLKTPKITNGIIDAKGQMSFKLPVPATSEFVKVSDVFGTGCTITPPDSKFVGANLFVQATTQTQASLIAVFNQKSPTGAQVGDELLDFWVYAPQAFTAQGNKGCSAVVPISSIDASFQQGWNYLVETVVAISVDGKKITEWKAKALNALPKEFVWVQKPSAASATSLLSVKLLLETNCLILGLR